MFNRPAFSFYRVKHMPLPTQVFEPFGAHFVTTAGGTTEIMAAETNTRLRIVSCSINVTTAGGAGTVVTIEEKTGSTDKIVCDGSAVGERFSQHFGEEGMHCSRGQGLQVVAGTAIVCHVHITGYKEKDNS